EPGVGEVAREHPAAAVHVVAHVVSVGVASLAVGVVAGALAIEDDHVVAPDHRRVLEEASVQVGAALAVQEVVPRGGGGPAAVRLAAVPRRGGVARATRAAAPAAAGDAVLRQEGEFVRLGAAPTVLRAARVAPRPVGARVAGGAARARVVRGPGAARRAIA